MKTNLGNCQELCIIASRYLFFAIVHFLSARKIRKTLEKSVSGEDSRLKTMYNSYVCLELLTHHRSSQTHSNRTTQRNT